MEWVKGVLGDGDIEEVSGWVMLDYLDVYFYL